jgi:hypothetical protein
MAGANITNYEYVLQEGFGEGVTFAVNTFTNVMNRFPISPKKFTGKRLRENIGYGMPSGGGAYGPSLTAVPDPVQSANIECYLWHAYIYDTIQIDWDVLEMTSGQHAYISAVKQEMTRVAQYRKIDFERMTMNDGSGLLAACYVDAGVNAGTVTPTTDFYFFVPNYLAIRFPINQRLEFWDGITNTATKYDTPAQGYYTVESVTLSSTGAWAKIQMAEESPGTNAPATSGTAVYVTKDEAVVENGSAATTNCGNEFPGLKAMISNANPPMVQNAKLEKPVDSTFQGIASTNSYWQSITKDGTGQYLNIDLVEEVGDDISIHGGGSADDIKFIIAHPFQLRKYRAELYPQERYPNTGNLGKFKSGSTTSFSQGTGPMIADKPTIKSRFCDVDRAYLVGPSIKHYDLKKWGFASKDGSMWRMNQQGRPAYFAVAYCYKTMGILKRNCSGVITGLTTT